MIRSFFIIFFGVLFLSFFLLKYFGLESALISFFSGAALGVINVAALYFTWKQILEKKNLVLSASVIVFKYPLLGFILYKVVSLKQISLGWFLIGMGTFFPIALLTVIFSSFKAPKNTKEITLKIEDEPNPIASERV